MSADTSGGMRYRFGDSSRAGVLLGLSFRQAAPLVAGVLWFACWLMVEFPVVGLVGLTAGFVVSFGRWRRAPLYEVAAPGARLGWRRVRGRAVWTRRSLLGAGPGSDDMLPAVMAGLELVESVMGWSGA
ncbi:MAG: hypothetical protein ABI862_14050, partial [Ilumatobacteraceae bacterium]